MELGNLIFGNSRGDWPIPRSEGWEDQIVRLLDALGCDGYETEYVSELFEVRPYYWGDCTCDKEGYDWEDHAPTCALVLPNFLFKPTGFSIKWYKYPFRDSYMNQKLSLKEFTKIIDQCIQALGLIRPESNIS